MVLWGLQSGVGLFQGRLWSNAQLPQGMCHRHRVCSVGGKLWLGEQCVSDIFLIKSKRCQLPRAAKARTKGKGPGLKKNLGE